MKSFLSISMLNILLSTLLGIWLPMFPGGAKIQKIVIGTDLLGRFYSWRYCWIVLLSIILIAAFVALRLIEDGRYYGTYCFILSYTLTCYARFLLGTLSYLMRQNGAIEEGWLK